MNEQNKRWSQQRRMNQARIRRDASSGGSSMPFSDLLKIFATCIGFGILVMSALHFLRFLFFT